MPKIQMQNIKPWLEALSHLVKHKQTSPKTRFLRRKDRSYSNCRTLPSNSLHNSQQIIHSSSSANKQTVTSFQIDQNDSESVSSSLE